MTAAAGRGRLPRETVLDWVTGGIVLVVYAIVQAALLQGPRPLDSARYFDSGVDFPDIPINLWTLRIGLVLPVRGAVLLFGPTEAALYAVPFVAGLLLAAAVYGTMLLLFHDRVLAAAAGLVTVLNTDYLFTSSHIYPDTTATATFTAGFFFLVLAAVRSERDRPGWAPTAAVVCAGLLFGWTYLIREFSLILVPAVLATVVLLRYPWRRVAILAGAALAMFAVELLYGLVRYRDPFVHADELLGRGDDPVRWRPERMDYIQAQLNNILDTTIVFPRLLLSWRSGWIFLLLLLVLFFVALVLFRDRRLWLFAAWFFSFWAIMAVIGLGSLPSGRWILNVTNVRYWYPIFPALVMGAFGGLGLLVQRIFPTFRGLRLTPVFATALTVVVLVPGVVEYQRCAARDAWGNDPAERWHELRSWFATPEADRFDVVWTDSLTHRLVPAFTRTTFGKRLWQGEAEQFPRPRRQFAVPTDEERALILLHKDRLRGVPNAQRNVNDLRRDWSPVFVTADGRMVVLAHRSVTTGDAVGGQSAWWSLTPDRGGARPGRCGRSPYEPGAS
jgi:hypothetical protein